MLELLTALTEKSLLAEGDGAPRYRMLDTIKEYARDRLAETGESDLARHAHLAYFTELTEAAEPHLRRAEQLDWLATLEAEHDNIGAAMRGALAAGEAQAVSLPDTTRPLLSPAAAGPTFHTCLTRLLCALCDHFVDLYVLFCPYE